MTGLIVLGVVLLGAVAFGLWRRATDGRLRPAAGAGQPSAVDPVHLTAAELQAPLGRRATLVQFSTVFCAPCRGTRLVLDEVAGMLPGVVHVDVDAEQNLELVRRLGVRRTPTVLVLDESGRIRTRAAGAPRKADVIAALGEFL